MLHEIDRCGRSNWQERPARAVFLAIEAGNGWLNLRICFERERIRQPSNYLKD
jgi:hypothetical protein